MSSARQVIFDTSKKEAGVPNVNMKKLGKKYKGQFQIGLGKEKLDYEKLKLAALMVFAGPKERFDKEELAALKKYVEGGGNLLFLSQEGGDRKAGSNISEFTSQFGIALNDDLVIRTSYSKYMHPTEAHISNGILSEEVLRVCHGEAREEAAPRNNFLKNIRASHDDDEEFEKEAARGGLDFLYANGTSLVVQKGAVALLSSGPLCYPSNRPLGAVWQGRGKGKLAVVGSTEMFSDDCFQLEGNSKLFDFFLQFFFSNEVQLEQGLRDDEREGVNSPVPDIAELADNLKSCFQESEDISGDITTMFDNELFRLDIDAIPDTVRLYDMLGLKHEPLTLIAPQFEVPLLGLAPAVFPPITKEPPSPPLELFDLDEEFAQERVRLAQCTNKCNNKDLEYFVREAGDILGVSDKVNNRTNPKSIIRYLFEQIVNFKRAVPR